MSIYLFTFLAFAMNSEVTNSKLPKRGEKKRKKSPLLEKIRSLMILFQLLQSDVSIQKLDEMNSDVTI